MPKNDIMKAMDPKMAKAAGLSDRVVEGFNIDLSAFERIDWRRLIVSFASHNVEWAQRELLPQFKDSPLIGTGLSLVLTSLRNWLTTQGGGAVKKFE